MENVRLTIVSEYLVQWENIMIVGEPMDGSKLFSVEDPRGYATTLNLFVQYYLLTFFFVFYYHFIMLNII